MHLPTATFLALLSLAACRAPQVSVNEIADTAAADAGAAARGQEPDAVEETVKSGSDKKSAAKTPAEKAAELKKKRKELRDKQRKLAHTRVEQQVAAIDRRVKAMTVEAELAKSARKLEAAQEALALFLGEQKPRELEEHRIKVDRSMHRADHSKDELEELTAMYEADEFAKATKELVLKRGRRSLEMAERDLAISKRELDEFENHTLPRRERELRDKVAEAELERKKAELEAEKAAIAQDLALLKEKEAISDLQEEIAELQKELEGKS